MLTFQAIRIFLNQEMQQLVQVLEGAVECIELGGRVVVVSFKAQEADLVLRHHWQGPTKAK